MAKILAVDDSLSMRRLVKAALKSSGYEISEASNSNEALEKLKVETFDLLLVDLYMPEIDGISLVKLIRSLENYQFTPILMLTTENTPAKKIEGKAAGATGWIVKPFNPDQLMKIIKSILE